MATVLAFLWHTYHCSFQELQAQVTEAMDELEQNTGALNFSRREMLNFLIGIPIAVAASTLIGRSGSLATDEILPLYATGVPACWKLYYSGGWKQVRDVLPTYISQLTTLVQSSTKSQKAAASLLSQAHQLAAYISLFDEENFGVSLTHCNQAFASGKLAEDANLQAASLMRRSDLYFSRGLPTLEINRQAVKYAEEGLVSPLLQSSLYSDWGACLADNGQRQDALLYQGMAEDVFPDDVANDAAAYTHRSRYALYFNKSLVHLRLGEPREASAAISRASSYVPETNPETRMELLKQLALASISMNDLEQSSAHFENMRLTACDLDSTYWQTELQHLAQQLRAKWPQEKRVRLLQEAVRPDGGMV